MPTFRSVSTAAAVALALSLAACGGDDDEPAASTTETTGETTAETPTEAPADEETTVEIVAESLAFEPERVSAPVGRVEFVLDNRDDGVPHNIAVTGNGVDEATELEDGPVTQRLTVEFDEAGDYTYVCEIHPAMQGEIEVG